MTIRNFTPHDIALYSEGDCEPGKGGLVLKEGAQPLATFPSEGVARAATREIRLSGLKADGVYVPLCRMKYGKPVDLPRPAVATCLIVSALTAQAAKEAGRTDIDLLIPAHLVRDAEGKVIGCTGFSVL